MCQFLSLTAKMSFYYSQCFLLAFFIFPVIMFNLPFSASQCSRKPVIFNFGDSNSDTGGLAAAMGYEFGYPDGRAFFHGPTATGRLCDGRLIIDFLCENLKANYLSPYLESLQPDFRNGVNFAVSGSAALPRNVAFSLSTQILQFRRFHNHSLQLPSYSQSQGNKDEYILGEDEFREALYMIDIGQNDLTGAFNSGGQVVEKIPSFISEIRDAVRGVYLVGGRNFWVHNTGPLGCLPEKLGTFIKPNTSQLLDQIGCIASMNQAAQVFNSMLKDACAQLQEEMHDSTVVYVDVYSIKYSLIANPTSYGLEKALMACCGHGGEPYNFDPAIKCRAAGSTVCGGDKYVSWDGVHYTQAANSIVASAILSTNYSLPPLAFNFFCK